MKSTIQSLYVRHRELVAYIFWGVMTTLVNYIVYFLLTHGFRINHLIANGVAWGLSVLFAYLVNKFFVFRARTHNLGVVMFEFFSFCGARVFSGLAETGILYLFVDRFCFPDAPVKIVANILVVILNYVFSKFFVFRARSR